MPLLSIAVKQSTTAAAWQLSFAGNLPKPRGWGNVRCEMADPVTRTWTWNLSAPPERLWPFVADTERVNKAAGLAVVQFDDQPLAEGGVCRMGHFNFLGLRVEWEEKPFEWQHGAWLRVERLYQSGPMLRLTTDFQLEPTPTGTLLRGTVSATPRGLWAVPILGVQIAGAVFAGFDRTFRHLEAFLLGRARFPYPDDPPRLAGGAEQVAEQARAAMAAGGIDPAIAEHVVDLAMRWPDRDVERVQPHLEAARIGVPRPRVLRALLLAADAGLYELLWDIRCPHCQGGPRSKRLGAVKVRNSCQSCNLSFAAKFDYEVAVSFTPSPRVRSATTAVRRTASNHPPTSPVRSGVRTRYVGQCHRYIS